MDSKNGKASILVVEDERIVALDIKGRLEQLGHRVPDIAATGRRAIEAASAARPDLILMDIKLQGDMDGISAAKAIHEFLDVPIVYLTAYGDEATLVRAKETSPYGYILKPFDERTLEVSIEMALLRHELVRRLSESEAWLSATLKSVGDAVVALDDEGRVRLMNERAEKLTGVRLEDALGRPEGEVLRVVERPVAGPPPWLDNRPQAWIVAKEGIERPIEVERGPIRDASGRLYGTVVVFRDVSEQKRSRDAKRLLLDVGAELASTLDADAALAGLSRRLVGALASGVVIQLVGEGGALRRAAVAHADPAAEERIRRALGDRPVVPPPATVVAETLRTGEARCSSSADEAFVGRALGLPDPAALAGLATRSLLCVPLAARGHTLGALTLLSDGHAFDALDRALAVDIGQRAAIALDHAALYADAMCALRVRDEMLAIVSHDLRNPLTTVLGNAEMLLRTPDDALSPERIRRYASGTRRAALRMQRLIGDLLDVARVDKGLLSLTLAPCAAGELVEEAIDAFVPGGGLEASPFVEDVRCGDTRVRCDRERIAQVFSNLVSNARAWSSAGGKITVRAERRGEEVWFSVADDGPGIPKEQIPHLFERFWRGPGAGYSGAGLGLYISKGIVDAHGGRIWVESEPGRGATFFFTLPVAAGVGAEQAA